MLSDESLDGLRQALQAWNEEVSSVVGDNLDIYVSTYPDDRWRLDSDGQYRRSQQIEYVWGLAAQQELQKLPSYAALLEAMEASSFARPLVRRGIETAISLSPFVFSRFAMGILASPHEFSCNDPSSFDVRCETLIKSLAGKEAEYQIIYYLMNVSFDRDYIELEPGLTIERLSSMEIEVALDCDIVKATVGSIPVYQPTGGESFGLRKIWRVPRVATEVDSRDRRERESELSNHSELGEELLQCLALLSGSSVYISGTIAQRIDEDFSASSGTKAIRSMATPRIFSGDPYVLDEVKCAELQKIWKLSRNRTFTQNRALGLAIRRLGFAAQRERVEDRIIDILIAAEAFYLADSGDARERGELKYRLALRAAVWSDGTLEGWTRREVFTQMKRAYDLRSAVAHGSEPKEKDVKVKDKRVSLADFTLVTEEIIRVALYKALNEIPSAAGKLSISWDDLVLPEDKVPSVNSEEGSSS